MIHKLDYRCLAKPVAWVYTINKSHSVFSAEKPPEDAYDEGTLFPLYDAPPTEAAIRAQALEDALRCYSPDDSAHDWADKIRAMKEE